MAAEQKDKPVPKYMNFVIGGLSGMAGAFILQPFDFVKTRMQMMGMGKQSKEYKSSLDVLIQVFKKEGPMELYNGVGASLLRQATYTTTRLGVYTTGFEALSANGPMSFVEKVLLAMGAGMCGAYVGTPADVCLVRMMSDGRLPPDQRRNYKNVLDALVRIVREEGVTALWKGAIPTTFRAIVVNASQLATYSQFKQMLLATPYFKDNIGVYIVSSMMSGFVVCVTSLPVDIVKTRIQNMRTGSTENRGIMNLFYTIIRNEGVIALWKGFTPYLARLGSHTVLVLIFNEQLSLFYQKYVLKNKGRKGSM